MRIGVISDTHGTLPGWVEDALAGVDLIIHAGDVGSPVVLDALELIAPVRAVRGNTDWHEGLSDLPDHARLDLEGVRIVVVHEPADASDLMTATPTDVVVVGHTHRPRIEREGEHLIVNPGSASYSRGEGHSVAILTIDGAIVSAEIVRVRGR